MWKADHRTKANAYMREWRKAHPLTLEQRRKDGCRSYAQVYLKRGKLQREPCEVCGSDAQMHHPDYSQPLVVFWLCRKHHHAFHQFMLQTREALPMMGFRWNGEAMVPLRPKAADKEYVIGQEYWLDAVSDRSWAAHRHEFAWIAEAWNNLPEALANKFPTPEHLRKGALIATGWHRETIIDAGNAAAALRVAAYARGEDEFAHVVTRGPTVTVRKARSQRMHGHDRMDKQEFGASKTAILDWISALIGVSADDLKGAA
jgi:hypothetical protein